MRRSFLALLTAAAMAAGAAGAQPWRPDPLQPAASGGLAAVDAALARLSVHARLLVVGAHPDDEDNALLTWVARGLGGEAAYLSLSRGEGGQNLIGPELGVELGALRTGELLAARALEGSRQYFARAYDFGYTRSLAETFARWPRPLLREDAVRIVRRFQPQVMVAVFPDDERAGHGQHQASALIAAEAFEQAGDPDLYPSLPEPPWAPAALYRRAWSMEEATHRYSLAPLEPLSGRSLGQLAAASRSFHRSQDMGRVQPVGPASGGVVWLAGGAGSGPGGDPFAGVDTRLAAIVETVPEGNRREEAAALLAEVERAARELRARLAPAALDAAVPILGEIVDRLRRAEALLAGDGAAAGPARRLVAEKSEVAAYALAAAAGVVIDAVAERETVPLGGALELEGVLWAAGAVPVTVGAITAEGRRGWQAEVAEGEPAAAAGGASRRRFRASVPGFAPPTMPYYLRQPRDGDLYSWENVPLEVRGEPFQPPPLEVRFELEIAGRPVSLVREVVYRWGDQAFGERRAPLRALPPVELILEPHLLLARAGTGTGAFAATVRSNVAGPLRGGLRLRPEGAEAEAPERPFTLQHEGDSETVLFTPRDPGATGRSRLTAEAVLEDGRTVSLAMPVVAYPHIRALAVPVAAVSEISRFELTLPRLARIGYIRGTSDRELELLAAVGLAVEPLDSLELERGELSNFDAIVVGSRAYETDATLRRHNDRLLEYVRAGGLLVVEYQQYQFVEGGFAPWPLEIARPHGRVTDETAPVELLVPEHPVFNHPNTIDAADWSGWVQERGLYFAGSWDERYRPLLAIADPGREAERGGLLVSDLGAGTYVYTGLSFFRQLPAGVAGAVRLFVNLLALGER